MMAGKLIELFGGSEFSAWFCTIEVWPERGKKQHGRLLRIKLEQKLNMEEVVKNGLLNARLMELRF